MMEQLILSRIERQPLACRAGTIRLESTPAPVSLASRVNTKADSDRVALAEISRAN